MNNTLPPLSLMQWLRTSVFFRNGATVSLLAVLILMGLSCNKAPEPSSTPSETQPATSQPTQEQASEVDAGHDKIESEGDTTPVVEQIQGIRITNIPGAGDSGYSIFDSSGKRRLIEHVDANTVVTVEPGRYVLKQPHSDFVYARDVVVKPGETTVVPMGMIKLTTVPGALFGGYHIFDASGKNRLQEHTAANTPVVAPPGRFVLREKYTHFTYATDVVVKADEMTIVEMGALRYDGPHDYHVFDASGKNRLREHGKPGELVTAAPGRYVLKKAYTDIVLADGVTVTAGGTTEVE